MGCCASLPKLLLAPGMSELPLRLLGLDEERSMGGEDVGPDCFSIRAQVR